MYATYGNHGKLEKVDVQKSKGEDPQLCVWVRGAMIDLALEPDEARWVIEALGKCLDHIPAVAADAPNGMQITVRSPWHRLGTGVELRPQSSPSGRSNIQPGEAPSKEGEAGG